MVAESTVVQAKVPKKYKQQSVNSFFTVSARRSATAIEQPTTLRESEISSNDGVGLPAVNDTQEIQSTIPLASGHQHEKGHELTK